MTVRRQALISVAVSGLAVVLAYVLVRHSPGAAIALLLVVPAMWLLTRADLGLIAGLSLILVLPAWETIGTAQVDVLRLAAVAAAATLLLSRRRLELCATDLAVLGLVLVLVLGWLLQYDQPGAGRVLSAELTPLGFYLGARGLERERLGQVLEVTLFAGTIGALTVIYEYLAGHTLFVDSLTYQWSASASTVFRPGGIFGGPPQASTVLCFVIVSGLATVRRLRGAKRALGIACLTISALALALTFTRAAFVAVAAAVLLYLWLTRSPLLRPAPVFGALVALALVVVLVLPSLQRTSTTIQEGILRPGTLAARESYWRNALPIAVSSTHNLVFGIGTAALETPAISPGAVVSAPLAVRPEAYQTSLHSQYVTALVEQGLIGLAALLAVLVVPLVRVARVARVTADPEHAALAAAILAVGIVMTVDTVLFDGPSLALTLTTIAFAATASAVTRRVQEDP